MSKEKQQGVLVLSGVDARFIDASLSLAKREYPKGPYFLKTEAGGVKPLLNWNPKYRSCFIDGLESVCHMHDIQTLILIGHEDSAAYGGSKAFIDKRAEANFHASQLLRAKQVLESSPLAEIKVQSYYAFVKGRNVKFRKVREE